MTLQDSNPTMTPDTVVGPTVKIQGDLNSDGNILIQGQVTGTVTTSQNLRVDDSAKINADITATNAIIAGEIKGNLHINEQLTLLATAKIIGDIQCMVLKIEEGAHLNGKCTMNHDNKTAVAHPSAHPKETKAELEEKR